LIEALRPQQEVVERDREKGAPCQRACPAGIDISRCHRLISLGKFDEALAVYREKVPFPAVLGHVCLAPCEKQCRLGEIDEPMAIRALKRFAAEKAGTAPEPPAAKPTGKKVAIVGSGPAGLTTAHYLAKLGHKVAVFEALPKPGGMMRVGIPEYRLPRSVLDKEIEAIERLGVELKLNSPVKKINNLFDKGYDAFLTTIGMPQGQKLPIPGADLEGILIGMSFLKHVNTGEKVKVGKKVLVLGGGGVATDCARIARRLGAPEVHMACLEERDCVPAPLRDVKEAEEEGIIIHPSLCFTKILHDNGNITGVECLGVSCMRFDEDGNLELETAKGSEQVLSADTVIFAVGQKLDNSLISDVAKIKLTTRGTIQVNPETLETGHSDVFAGGDAVRGPSSVIEAIADGRQAAISIDKYLGGKGVIDEVLAPPEVEVTPQVPLSLSVDQVTLPSLPVAERLAGFAEVELSLSDEAAMGEAKRCFWCDLELVADAQKCAQCHTCQLICSLAYTKEFNLSKARIIIDTGKGTEGEEPKFTDECIHCNLCARYCAYDAVSLRKGGN